MQNADADVVTGNLQCLQQVQIVTSVEFHMKLMVQWVLEQISINWCTYKHGKAFCACLTIVIFNLHCGSQWRPLQDPECLECWCNTEVKEELFLSLVNGIIDNCHYTTATIITSRDGNS